jgi:thioredoxin reductase (NADPH)
MAIRSHEIYPKTKYWIKPNIENRITEGAIKAYFNSEVVEIKEQTVGLKTPDGLVEIPNDFVLAMIGYMPNYHLFESLGLPIDSDVYKTPLQNEETLETPLSNVYVAGVIKVGLQTSKLFIENTREHGDIIIQNLLSKS